MPGGLSNARNVYKEHLSVDMLLLADYAARMGKDTGRAGTLLGLDTDFSLVRDTSSDARLNRVAAARCSRLFRHGSQRHLTEFVAWQFAVKQFGQIKRCVK